MSFATPFSSISANAQALQQVMSAYGSDLSAGAAAVGVDITHALELQGEAAGESTLAAAGIAAGTTVAAIALTTTAFAVGAAIPVAAAGVAGAAAVASTGAATASAAGAVGAAAGAAVLQGARAYAECPIAQALLDARPHVAEGLQQAVALLDGLRDAEPRNPLLLPEPWSFMLSTLAASR